MKKIFLTLICALFIQAGVFAEGGAEFSGSIETLWGASSPWTERDSRGRFTLGTTSFTGKLDAYYGNSSAYAEASFTYDSVAAQNGENSEDSLKFSCGELWADYTDSFWGVRIGRQKTAWGKADGIDIVNVICPSDYSSVSAMVSDDSKLPVESLRLSLNGSSFMADVWWIPFFTSAELPAEYSAVKDFLEKPEAALWNGEYGVKVSGYFSALDFSLYGFYGWDDLPFLSYSPDSSVPGNVLVSGGYERFFMLGTDAALPLGETVLRLEGAFFPNRHFQKKAEEILKEASLPSESESTEERNQISALAGLDWMPEGWTLTAQYYCDALFGSKDTLERERTYEHGATLSVSKTLLNETLELSFAGVLGLNDFDSFMNPSVKYSVSDQISAECGAYVFISGPENDGTYGKYKDLSSFYINVKFSF